eukprot:Skav208042  [mRNA]  locus=scaffold2536:25242:27310:- [translate_table: standard]
MLDRSCWHAVHIAFAPAPLLGDTPAHEAAGLGQVKVLQELIEAGANLHVQNAEPGPKSENQRTRRASSTSSTSEHAYAHTQRVKKKHKR